VRLTLREEVVEFGGETFMSSPASKATTTDASHASGS
jgi:hypothetical protein